MIDKNKVKWILGFDKIWEDMIAYDKMSQSARICDKMWQNEAQARHDMSWGYEPDVEP